MSKEADDDVQAKPRVLVTGANGFVGSAIVKQCLLDGLHVRTTGRTDKNSEHLSNYFKADVTEPSSLTEAMNGIDVVVHSAGLAHQFDKGSDEAAFFEINTRGTENVARAAAEAGVSHFVLISSVSVYGPHEEAVCDESSACNPQEAYAKSKLEAEQRAMEIFTGTNACLTILRLATVYGEGDRGNLLRLISTIDRGRFIWIGRGENRKSLVHCDDVARATVAVLSSPCEGIHVYNVSALPQTMREIVETITARLGRPTRRWHIPQSLALSLATLLRSIAGADSKFGALKATIEKWLADDVYDARKFAERFAVEMRVPLEEGLRSEVDWYRTSVR